MLESYSIGIRVFLNNQVGKGLTKLGADLRAAQMRVNALQRDMERFQRQASAEGPLARAAARQKSIITTNQARMKEMHGQQIAADRVLSNQLAASTQKQNVLSRQKATIAKRAVEAEAAHRTAMIASANDIAKKEERLRLNSERAALAKEGFASKEKRLAEQIANNAATAGIANQRHASHQIRHARALKNINAEIDAAQTEYEKRRRLHQASRFMKDEINDLKAKRTLIEQSGAIASAAHAKTIAQTTAQNRVLQEQVERLPGAKTTAAARYAVTGAAITQDIDVAQQRAANAATRHANRIKNLQELEGSTQAALGVEAARIANVQQNALEKRAATLAKINGLEDKNKAAVAAGLALEQQRVRALELAKANQLALAKEQERVTRLEARRERSKRMAKAGGLMMAGGAAGLYGLYNTLDEAGEYAHRMFLARAMGAGIPEPVEKKAWEVVRNVPATSINEAILQGLELHKVLGNVELTTKVMEAFARDAAALNFVEFKGDPKESLVAAARALEYRGASGNPERFMKELELITRVSAYTGGRVSGSTYQMFFKHGGPGIAGLSQDFLYTELPWLLAAFQSKAGAGQHGGFGSKFAALYRWAGGRSGINPQQGELLEELGLMPNFIKTKAGMKPKGGLLGYDIFQQNPFQWVQEVFIPQIMKKFPQLTRESFEADNIAKTKVHWHGEDMTLLDLVGRLGQQNAMAALTFMSHAAGPVAKEKSAIQRAMLPPEIIEQAQKRDPEAMKKVIAATWETVKTRVGLAVMPEWMSFLTTLNEKLGNFLEMINNNQPIFTSFVKGFGEFSALLVVAGGAMLVLAGLNLTGLGFAIEAVATGIGGFAGLPLLAIAAGITAVYYAYKLWKGETITPISDAQSVAGQVHKALSRPISPSGGSERFTPTSFGPLIRAPKDPLAAFRRETLATTVAQNEAVEKNMLFSSPKFKADFAASVDNIENRLLSMLGNIYNALNRPISPSGSLEPFKPKQDVNVHNTVNLDGDIIHKSVMKKTLWSADRQSNSTSKPDYSQLRTQSDGKRVQ